MADTTMSTYSASEGFCHWSMQHFQQLSLSRTTPCCTDLKVSLMHYLQTVVNNILITVYLHFSEITVALEQFQYCKYSIYDTDSMLM